MSQATLPKTSAGPDFATICTDMFVRRMGRTIVMENALAISEHYNGRVVVPMPEMDADERPAIANLIAQNIDQHAMRVASVRPSITVYATDPSKAAAQKLARAQKRVLYSWDDDQQRELFDRRRARWLTAWAEAPVVIRPDPVRRCPRIELRSPLGCYPSPLRQYDDMQPIDTINVYERTYQWLKTAYPQLDTLLNVGRRVPYQNDARFEVIEYDGPEALVTGVLGVGTVPPLGMLGDLGFVAFTIAQTAKGQTYAIELERIPNLIEESTAVVPGRITLDMPKGLADDMVGIFQMEAKMLALHVNAVARAIYPNDWFVETAQGGEIITQADGLKGITGHVRGGTMQTLGSQPGAQTMGVINALERNGRISGAAPAEYGGESPTNVRTAQRGLNVASNAIDFYIQEHQQILARSEQYEKDKMMRTDKAYFAKDKKSYFVNSGPNQGQQSYVPEQLWATVPKIKVKFNNAGMDANAIVTSNGQKLGEGTISRQTVMEQDPAIEDVEAETGRVTVSHLQDALIAGTSQQVQSGQIALTDLAQISLYVESGDYTLAEALLQVQKEAQVRQASAGPQGAPDGPVAPGSPPAQVGLQAGAAGAAQPTVGGPSPSQVNLKQLLSTLAAGQNIAPQGGQQS